MGIFDKILSKAGEKLTELSESMHNLSPDEIRAAIWEGGFLEGQELEHYRLTGKHQSESESRDSLDLARSLSVARRIEVDAPLPTLANFQNPLSKKRGEADKLKNASISSACCATEACQIGKLSAAGRAETARRKTATKDLKDHWNRAIRASSSEDALAELEHASKAAIEAHGSDEYEERAIDMIYENAYHCDLRFVGPASRGDR